MRDEIDDVNALNTALILNKCAAIIACDFGTASELGRFIGKPRTRVYEWLTRRVTPQADTLFAMRKWASAKTLGISAAGAKVQNAYRTAYEEICEQTPVNGNGKDT